MGEPWQSSMEIDDVTTVLARAGLPAPELPTPATIAGYLGDRTDGLQAPKRQRLASVVVA